MTLHSLFPLPVARLATALVAVAIAGCRAGPTRSGTPPETFTEHLDTRVPALLDTYGVPGAALALVHDGAVVWTGAYGTADGTRPVTAATVFRAESVSKSLTAWGVLRLAEQDRVDLDAPAARYFGGWTLPDPSHAVPTVRQLLSHDAGMPLGTIGEEYAPGAERPTLRTYLTREARPERPPGSGFAYSNVGFNVLELLVEEVGEQDFAAFMRDEVLEPLGMASSAFGWSGRLGERMATGHEASGDPVAPYVYPSQTSGGLLATAGDLGKFVVATVNGGRLGRRRVLREASVQELHAPHVAVGGAYGVVADAYGLGHFVETLPDGRRAVWHGGQGHGWMSHVHAVPEASAGVVILTNSERSWPLMAAVLGDWSEWAGLGAVGMERIGAATEALRALLAVLALGTLGQAVRLGLDLHQGRRRWAPRSRRDRGRRGLAALSAGAVIAALGWAASQPYLMVAAVFPCDVGWAAGLLAASAFVLLLSAGLPRTRGREPFPSVRP